MPFSYDAAPSLAVTYLDSAKPQGATSLSGIDALLGRHGAEGTVYNSGKVSAAPRMIVRILQHTAIRRMACVLQSLQEHCTVQCSTEQWTGVGRNSVGECDDGLISVNSLAVRHAVSNVDCHQSFCRLSICMV